METEFLILAFLLKAIYYVIKYVIRFVAIAAFLILQTTVIGKAIDMTDWSIWQLLGEVLYCFVAIDLGDRILKMFGNEEKD